MSEIRINPDFRHQEISDSLTKLRNQDGGRTSEYVFEIVDNSACCNAYKVQMTYKVEICDLTQAYLRTIPTMTTLKN